MKNICLVGLVCLASFSFGQELTASEFESTPAFTETFAGGATVGHWVPAAGNLIGAVEGTYITTTPASVAQTVKDLNIVEGTDGVMMLGNDSSSNGSLFGLDYMHCVNSKDDETGDDFSALAKYRVVAKMYLFTPTQKPERWQVGPIANTSSDLFYACAFYNTSSTGGGPGFGLRGVSGNTSVVPGTTAITESGWYKLSIMVDTTDVDTANWRIAICVDANHDDTLDEADPLEYLTGDLLAAKPAGPFGVFTVGEVNTDGFPLFTDEVSLYLPATSGLQDWAIY